ncbi:MAG: hypothetical protein K2Q26_10095 [Bdellovibrionales bacterium]|nr:hypothetical protein [Bdellovibrionales bacterium]
MTVVCYSCAAPNPIIDRVGFRDECSQCHMDLHVCKTCGFYDPKVYNECREPSAEVVRDKEKANYCEYYQPGGGAANEAKKREDLKAAAEALFKKKG